MSNSCFICNILVRNKEPPDLFTEHTTIVNSVAKLLSDIVDKPVFEGNIHTSVVCKQCYATCLEYDNSKKRMQEIKTELTNAFKMTLPKHGLEYNTYPKKAPITPKKVVVSASKLQPLPPNFVIDVSKIPKQLNVNSSPTVNLKVTIGSTVLTHSFKDVQSSPLKLQTVTADKAVESNIANSLSSILGIKTSTSVSSNSSVLTFNVNSLSKDFCLTTNSETSEMKQEVIDKDVDDDEDDNNDDFNNDEQPMEIDEECTITKITGTEHAHDITENDNDESDKRLFDVSLLPVEEGADNDTILGKLQILDKDDDDDEGDEEGKSIMMTDESGAVIRFMVSGQRLVYDNGALTLADRSRTDQGDGGDSNDDDEEAQIELQVSGDEETANAIIAAAKEQGGAFIKVESGEMFRVKSVEGGGAAPLRMVDVRGNKFSCLLCHNTHKESTSESPSKESIVVRTADEMMIHLRTEHNARLYICKHCKKIMRKRTEYQAHLRSCQLCPAAAPAESKGKLHECAHCGKKFTSRTLLQEHLNVHTGARPYRCSVCDKTFASKYTHQTHLKTHMERPRPFKCSECPKSFLSQQNLTQHAKTHLGIKDFVCGTCGKAFGTQHNLEVHYVVHSKSKPFVCGACGKPFARRAEVKDHMRIHTGERPFSCDICGAAFTQRSNLNSHKRATHMDDKRYHCQDCPKRFKRRRLLDYHVKVSHTGERPLECEICHARFVYPEHYKKHARIHSGDKPYECEVCGKTFNSRDNRNTHRFVHSDKKPYECLVCGAGYMRKQLLYAHMNTTGHLAESIVVNQPRVQKVNENGSRSKTDDSIEMLFETKGQATEELEASNSESRSGEVVISEAQDAPQYIIDEKGSINIVQESDDPALLTLIQNLDGSKTGEIQTITAEQLGEQVQVVTADENGAIRVVQLHLGAANSAWITQ